MQTLGDGPIEDAYRAQMIGVVHALDSVFNGEDRGRDPGKA